MRRTLIPAAAAALALAGCASAQSQFTAPEASQFFRSSVASHYHGTVPTGDGRGCVKVSSGHYSCAAYVRGQHLDLLGTPDFGTRVSELDVLGTVTVGTVNTSMKAHVVSGAAITAWFLKTGGTSG